MTLWFDIDLLDGPREWRRKQLLPATQANNLPGIVAMSAFIGEKKELLQCLNLVHAVIVEA